MMKTTIFARRLLAVAVFAAALAGAAHAQSPAVDMTNRARQLLVDRQFQPALAELDKAIASDASYPVAYYLRGFALANMGRPREALDAFVMAADLSPGWGDAHRMAAVTAINTGELGIAWDQAVKAHQAGAEVGDTFNRLLAMERAPGDLDQQLGAARIFVMPMDTEKLAARQDNPFGTQVIGGGGGGGDITSPFNTSTSRATNVGGQQIAESQSQFFDILRQTRRSLADSKSFGVVANQEMAQFLLVIEIDELGRGGQKSLEGYIKLYDARSGEEAYRRRLELRNIDSRADLNADLERYVDYLEEWLRNRAG